MKRGGREYGCVGRIFVSIALVSVDPSKEEADGGYH